MKRHFARASALTCGYFGATTFVAAIVQLDSKVPYITMLWRVAPWTLVVCLMIGGLIWGIENWDSN